MCFCVSSIRFTPATQGSVAEESPFEASAETVVGHFAVSVVCDNTVVTVLLSSMCDDGRPDIRAAPADLRHSLALVSLHAAHALLGGPEEPRVLIILLFGALLHARHPDKSLALLGGRRLII